MIEKIKLILYQNKDKLINILEKLGCHKINPYNNEEIRCALPDGETNTSVQVILSEFMSVQVYSRPDYEDYEIKDIISFVEFILKCNFKNAVLWLCKELGIEYNEDELIIRDQPEIIKCLNRYAKKDNITMPQNDIMDEKILNQYPLYVVPEWVKEGINAKTQKKYGIRIDKKRNRWIIPIRDKNNNLVAIKGRTYLPDYGKLNIQKYIYYKKKEDKNKKYYNNILFGLNFHFDDIKKDNEIILFEGEKSVMKAEDMGFLNCVCIGKNGINRYLLPKILQLHVDVVLALDKDVSLKTIIKQCKKLSMFTNVYYIYDKNNLLDKKDAPVDKGLGVWLELYSNKRRIL